MKLNDTQISQVDAQIKRLLNTESYYGNVYRNAGISGVTSQEDFEKLPFSSKKDLRNAYPLGIQAVPDEEVVRIHSSSGTTGKPVIITTNLDITGILQQYGERIASRIIGEYVPIQFEGEDIRQMKKFMY